MYEPHIRNRLIFVAEVAPDKNHGWYVFIGMHEVQDEQELKQRSVE